MVATLRSALLRQAFLLNASWNDPLTLKLMTRIWLLPSETFGVSCLVAWTVHPGTILRA